MGQLDVRNTYLCADVKAPLLDVIRELTDQASVDNELKFEKDNQLTSDNIYERRMSIIKGWQRSVAKTPECAMTRPAALVLICLAVSPFASAQANIDTGCPVTQKIQPDGTMPIVVPGPSA